MIGIQVNVVDGVSAPLERFGAKAGKMLDKILSIIGYRYRKHLRKNYLSGQMLSISTGALVKSLVVGRKRGAQHVYLVGSKPVKDRMDLGGVVIRRTDSSPVKLANIFEHQGGYVIEPKNKQALVIPIPGGVVFRQRAEGKARPFMSESARSFDWNGAIQKTTDEVVAKALAEEKIASDRSAAWQGEA
jgi:hypothetical protein